MLWIHGFGHFHPEVEITNRFLEELEIGTTEQWIMDRVGIHSRRTVLPLDYIRATYNHDPRAGLEAALYDNAETGRRAAEMAIERAGLTLADIGLVIAGSCAPDTVSPAEACNVACALGLEVPAYDINSACSTFSAQLYTLSMMRPDALPPFVLVVVPENTTRCVDFRDRKSAVLWGDGSAAVVVSTQHPGRFAVLGNTLASSPAGHRKVFIPRIGHFAQEGPAVQKFAITRSVQCVRALQAEFSDVSRERFNFVGHQANRLMLESVCRSCEIAPEQHHFNVNEFGNTGAAGAPSVISARWHQWQPGDYIAVVGVGSGLTWSSYMLRCEHPAARAGRRAEPSQEIIA